MILALYLSLGAVAGLLAGLFGIGGGVIIVPVLIFSFTLQGIETTWLMHMAIATSLASIIFTSISSIITHQKKGAIQWHLAKPIAVGMLLGAFFGVHTAISLPSHWLQGVFGVFVLYLSFKMLILSRSKAQHKSLPKTTGLSITGVIIGWASALFGIGGGNLLVSWLVNRGLVMQQAVATAAACGLAIGITGTLTNIVTGWQLPDLPEYTIGFVYLPALFGIVMTSATAANIGAKIAHRIPAKRLQQLPIEYLPNAYNNCLLASY